MKTFFLFFSAVFFSTFNSGCLLNDSAITPKLSWVERAFAPIPSRLAAANDRLDFKLIAGYSRKTGKEGLQKKTSILREGDLIAARLGKIEAGTDFFLKWKKYAGGYTFLKYGHLDLVVRDPSGGDNLVLFTCNGSEGVNIKRQLSDLGNRDWDVYRMNNWGRVNRERLFEFVRISLIQEKGGESYGDLSSLGFGNANLKPKVREDIKGDYTCSTVIAAALYYAGVELDNTRGTSNIDLVSPNQIVTSKGGFIVYLNQ